MADEFDTVPVETPEEFQNMDDAKIDEGFPSFRYGPDDQAQVFYRAKDVPAGWEDHPSKVKQPKKAEPKKAAEAKNKDEKPAPKAGGLGDLRKQYKALTGKNPSPRATAEQLVEAIEAAEAEK